MPIRFVTIAIIVLLIAGGAALGVALNDDPATPSVATDRNDDRKSDIERELEAVLNDDDDEVTTDQTEDDGDDTGDTKGSKDTNDSKKTGGSGGSGGGGEAGDG